MMTTERDAKGKMCPHMHASTLHEGCLGTRCMAWRFAALPFAKRVKHRVTNEEFGEFWEKDLPDPERPANVPPEWEFSVDDDGCFWVEDMVSRTARRVGYCGLAGLPEVSE